MKNIIFLVAALLALCNASCNPTVKATQRGGTWAAGSGTGAIFDVVVTNSGSCPLTSINLIISLPTGAIINNFWNLVNKGTYYEVTNYQGSLPASSSVNTGLSINFPSSPSPITVSFQSSTCDASCSSSPSTPAPTIPPSTSAPTTPPSTTAPTTPPSTIAPTTPPSTLAPTNPPTPSCNIAASLRLGSAWTTDGVSYASYHLFLTNNGACDLKDYVTSFALNGGEIYQTWNLQSTRGGYLVQGYGSALHSGDSYGGAGFNVKNAGNIQITPYGSNCQC